MSLFFTVYVKHYDRNCTVVIYFFFFEQEISKIFWIESNRFDESPKKKKRNVKRKIGLSHIEVKQIENYYY